jgi:hypothetical protein
MRFGRITCCVALKLRMSRRPEASHPESIMAKSEPTTSETTTEDYEDHRAHLAKQPHDILIAWAVVCCLALGVIIAYSNSASLRLEPELPVNDAANLLPRPTHAFYGEEATLAEEIGMIPKPKE